MTSRAPVLAGANLAITPQLPLPDFVIPSGRCTFLWGESGSGKSTLLKFCNATATPYQGEVTYEGTPVFSRDTVLLRQEVILVAQQVFLFDGTIYDNFVTYHSFRNTPVPSRDEIAAMLKICQFHSSVEQPVHELSGGQRHRVFIALHLSFNPKVLMLDEPTAALDNKTAHELMESLTQYAQANKLTLVVITHDKELMDEFADHVIQLGE